MICSAAVYVQGVVSIDEGVEVEGSSAMWSAPVHGRAFSCATRENKVMLLPAGYRARDERGKGLKVNDCCAVKPPVDPILREEQGDGGTSETSDRVSWRTGTGWARRFRLRARATVVGTLRTAAFGEDDVAA